MKRKLIANITLESTDFIRVDKNNGLPIDKDVTPWHYTDIINTLNQYDQCFMSNESDWEWIAVTRLPRELQWEVKKAILQEQIEEEDNNYDNKKEETK